jgi:hypothetical protein
MGLHGTVIDGMDSYSSFVTVHFDNYPPRSYLGCPGKHFVLENDFVV